MLNIYYRLSEICCRLMYQGTNRKTEILSNKFNEEFPAKNPPDVKVSKKIKDDSNGYLL